MLGGGVVQEGNPKVGGQVELIEGGSAGVLVREFLGVQTGELHGVKETLPWHELHAADDLGDGGLELVVVNNNLVVTFSLSLNLVSDGHNCREVAGGTNIRDGVLDHIREGSDHSLRTLLTNRHDSDFCSVLILYISLQLPNDTGVNTTAQTLIRCEGNEELGGIVDVLKRRLALQVLVALEHHIYGLVAEVLSVLKSPQLTSHLGSGDHLHGLGDLTDRVDRLLPHLDLLLVHSEGPSCVLHEGRRGVKSIGCLG